MTELGPSPTYWLDLFTGKTWAEFLASDADVSGFREARWSRVQKMRPGDYLLCYLTGISRFVGILEVVSEPYKDSSPVWQDETFPSRVKVRRLVILTPETAVPVKEMLPKFSWYGRLKRPSDWFSRFQGSPERIADEDGRMIVAALREAESDPVTRPFDSRLLRRRAQGGKRQPPPTVDSERAEPAQVAGGAGAQGEPPPDVVESESIVERRQHVEVEGRLLQLGSEMGLQLWIDRKDGHLSFGDTTLDSIPGVVDELPTQFSTDLAEYIRRIDVLWLRDGDVIAAFEVESTTRIYTGLLRMADLVALQPHLNISLFIVAPEGRRDSVRKEMHRPTFSRGLRRPLANTCRYISFERLKQRYEAVEQFGLGRALVADEFLDAIAEKLE